MSIAVPRHLDPEGTRAAILDAAQVQFVERGYAATSMAAIAKAAGVTKSLIHHHFGSKRELWDAVKLRAVSSYHSQQSAMLDEYEPNLQLIADSMITYFRYLRESPDMVRLLSWMAVEGDDACSDVLQGLTDQGLATIAEGQRRGLLRDDIPPNYILCAFFTLVRGWFTEAPLLSSCVGSAPQEQADEQYLQGVLKIFLQGLRPPTTPDGG